MSSSVISWSEKTKAVQLYMLNGNMRLVSELVGIPYQTLMDWKRTEWWPSLVEELRNAKRAKTGTKLSSIIDTSLEIIQDRLENGDYILNNKTGQIERKPVTLRDTAALTNSLLTRQMQMEEIADRMENSKTTVQETLTLLAKEFQKMTKKTTDYVDVEIKETTNAIHEGGPESTRESMLLSTEQGRENSI
jgi:hypothetical protein